MKAAWRIDYKTLANATGTAEQAASAVPQVQEPGRAGDSASTGGRAPAR